jgi:hypothetical protein
MQNNQKGKTPTFYFVFLYPLYSYFIIKSIPMTKLSVNINKIAT